VKLVACPQCHAQYDVSQSSGPTISCRCGATIKAEPPAARDATVTRCSACGALVGDKDRACAYCGAGIVRRPPPSGPVCPECYAQNPEGAKFCVSCATPFLPQPVRVSVVSLACPVCPDSALVARDLGGIWVDECPSCLGLWTPDDVLDRLVDRVRERAAAEGTPAVVTERKRRSVWQAGIAYRKCPECQAGMQRRNFAHRSGVVVDWCGSHGTWLDAHELEDIASFVLEGGLRTAPAATGGDAWNLPSDPNRAAALAAAERIIAEEKAREGAKTRGWNSRGAAPDAINSIGDLLTFLLTRRI
jgi:Zn-finger nucleic acid-binding protein